MEEAHDTAWIVHGEWMDWPSLTLTQPDPPDWQLAWSNVQTNWVLESSTALGPVARWETVPGLPTRSLGAETLSVSPHPAPSFFRLRKP
jgi:hypothetical protein